MIECRQKVRDRYSVITSHLCGDRAKAIAKWRDGRWLHVCGTHANMAERNGARRQPLLYAVRA